MAMYDGQFTSVASVTPITPTTAADALPKNVAKIMSFVTLTDFNTMVANQKTKTGLPGFTASDADPPVWSSCADCAGFLDYWSFLTAMAHAPAFCDGAQGSSVSDFSGTDLCKKEIAAMVAVIVSITNHNDDTLTYTDPETQETKV